MPQYKKFTETSISSSVLTRSLSKVAEKIVGSNSQDISKGQESNLKIAETRGPYEDLV
jgi:hypothetical protein